MLHRRRALLVGAGLGLILAGSCARPRPATSTEPVGVAAAAPSPTGEDARVVWLREHAVPLRTLDASDQDFSDLEPLVEALADTRVIILGEQSHGDGTAFRAKVRLVEFLHQRLGFSVLAFESDMFACTKAWAQIEAGDDPQRAASECVFSIWSASEQVAPLWEYLGRHARSESPLRLWGIDSQFYARASARSLFADMRAYFDRSADITLSDQQWDVWEEAIQFEFDRTRLPTQALYERAVEVLQALEARTDALPHDPEAEFWRQMLTSITVAYAGEDRWKPIAQRRGPGASAYRDRQMADNVRWLAEERFAHDKIIVWAATLHGIRNPNALYDLETGRDFAELSLVTMGDVLAETMEPDPVVVGFLAHSGRSGMATQPMSTALPTPLDGSLEDLCHRAGLRDAIIDLRESPDGAATLRAPLVAGALGYAPMRAVWPDLLDLVVFDDRMEPSRPIRGDGQPGAGHQPG